MKKKVALACELCHVRNYYTLKTGDNRLIKTKHCNKCNKHTTHKEEK